MVGAWSRGLEGLAALMIHIASTNAAILLEFIAAVQTVFRYKSMPALEMIWVASS